MPLDTSTYSLALLRLDGRRWNELRRIHAQISTQAAADGSSYLEMGNTKVMCTVSGPAELRRAAAGGTGSGGGGGSGATGGSSSDDRANVVVDVKVAGFSGVDRKRSGRTDKRLVELQSTLASAFSSTLFTHLYPRSTISIALHVLAQDGALLAASVNAATLALIDAGIPASDYLVACTAGSSLAASVLNPHMSRHTIPTPISRPQLPTADSEHNDDPQPDTLRQSTDASKLSASSQTPGEALKPNGPLAATGNGADRSPDPLLDLSGAEEQELPFLTVATVGASERVSILVMESRARVDRLEGMLAVAVDGCKQVRAILDGVVHAQGKRLVENSAARNPL